MNNPNKAELRCRIKLNQKIIKEDGTPAVLLSDSEQVCV